MMMWRRCSLTNEEEDGEDDQDDIKEKDEDEDEEQGDVLRPILKSSESPGRCLM